MQLNEITFGNALPVDSYGPGFFRVAGKVHEGAILVLPEGVRHWAGLEDVDTLVAAADALDVLFVGTGGELVQLPKPFVDTLEAAGLGLEPMNSPTACRTYNVLLSEGRRVGLAVLPV